MTRRCNLDCDFCARGKAQNMTITKAIIDKTLDELKGCYIDGIRLNGGEPFLVPGMIEYLVDQIIKKEIAICSMFMFTNGTIRDEQIAQSLNRIADYINVLKQKDDKIRKINDSFEKSQEYTKNVTITFSTNGHSTTDKQINKTRDWYIDHLDFDNASCYFQSRNNRLIAFAKGKQHIVLADDIKLEGNALLNYKKLLTPPVDLPYIKVGNSNHYSFINDLFVIPEDNEIYSYVEKTITISANGNVFPGSLMSYERVDAEKLFNIMDCSGNFYEKIDAKCWEYPLGRSSHKVLGLYNSFDFCREKGIQMCGEIDKSNHYIDQTAERTYCVKDWILKCMDAARILHTKYKHLNHAEIEELAIFKTAWYLCDQKYPLALIEYFLTATFGPHKESSSYKELQKVCEGVITEITKRNDDPEYAEQDRLKIANMKREGY